jgi:hypothetical protein
VTHSDPKLAIYNFVLSVSLSAVKKRRKKSQNFSQKIAEQKNTQNPKFLIPKKARRKTETHKKLDHKFTSIKILSFYESSFILERIKINSFLIIKSCRKEEKK